MIRKNTKVLIMFILGAITAVGTTISASNLLSKNIIIKDSKWNVKNVEDAVNYLKDEKKCAGLNPSLVKVISGDINTAGSIVQIGDEEFYVVGQGTGKESGKVKLLAKYALSKDYNQETKYTASKLFSSTNYWNGKVGDNLKYPGSYSGSTKPYVYDENSNLYSMVESYVDKIKKLGVNSVTGRLMSYEEANGVSEDIRKDPAPGCYWLGSLYSDDTIWYVNTYGNFLHNRTYNEMSFHIRPIILISTNEIGG